MRRTCLFLALLASGCESKEDRLAAAEANAKEQVELQARMVKGVGEALQGEGKVAMEAVTAGAGELVTGVGRGVEKGTALKATLLPELAAKGVEATRASHVAATTVSAYLIFNQPYAGPVAMRALGTDGGEVGRAVVRVDEPAGSAKYFDFVFDERVPLAAVENVELR